MRMDLKAHTMGLLARLELWVHSSVVCQCDASWTLCKL